MAAPVLQRILQGSRGLMGSEVARGALGAGIGAGVGALEDQALAEQLHTPGLARHSGLAIDALLGGMVGTKAGRAVIARNPTLQIAGKVLAVPALHAAASGIGAVGNLTEATRNIADTTGVVKDTAIDTRKNVADIAHSVNGAAGQLQGTLKGIEGASNAATRTLDQVNNAAASSGSASRVIGDAAKDVSSSVKPIGQLAGTVDRGLNNAGEWLGGLGTNWDASHSLAVGAAGAGAAALLYGLLHRQRKRKVLFPA